MAGSLWIAKSQRTLRLAAEQKEKRTQRAERDAAEQKQIAIDNGEQTRQLWRHSLGEMDQFYQVLGREMGLGIQSPEELRTRANRLVFSLYGDYVRRLGHYACMQLQVGKTVGAGPLFAEARQLIADRSLPDSLKPQCNLLLGSFDQMESELRSAMSPSEGVPETAL